MFKKFLKDESGNIAIIGSLAMIPLVLLTSLAVDHASTVSKES